MGKARMQFWRLVGKVVLVAFATMLQKQQVLAGHLDIGNPGRSDIVVEHKGYAVGFSMKHRQAI